MHGNHGPETPCPQKEKTGIPAEHGGVAKLEQGTEQGGEARGVGMGQGELVEVVNVG